MQLSMAFVSSYPWRLATGKRSLYENRGSRRVILSRNYFGSFATQDQSRKKLYEYLCDSGTGFEWHHKIHKNRNAVELFCYSPLVSKMCASKTPGLPTPTIPNLSMSQKHFEQALRSLYEAQQDQSGEDYEVIERLYRQADLTGSINCRNAFFLGIPYKCLRAHEAFHALPTSLNVRIDGHESLTSLRQDCEPFEAAWQTLQLRANEVWPLLGFGEVNPIALLLPPRCRGHAQALNAWKRLFSPTVQVKKRNFNQRFAREHIGNATLSYMLAEQTRWHQCARVAPTWCEAVQLLETGCHVSRVPQIPLAAAPVAQVARRNKDDFWMWGSVDTILIAKTEYMYSYASRGECRLSGLQVRSELDLLSWIEAQFSMLCCGEQFRFADVVWYATLGGSSVFRIKRDDTFLEAGLKAIERFIVQFVDAGYPPHVGFERGTQFSCMAQRIKERSKTIVRLSYDRAHIAETRLMPWRKRMTDWELKRSQNPFYFSGRKLPLER